MPPQRDNSLPTSWAPCSSSSRVALRMQLLQPALEQDQQRCKLRRAETVAEHAFCRQRRPPSLRIGQSGGAGSGDQAKDCRVVTQRFGTTVSARIPATTAAARGEWRSFPCISAPASGAFSHPSLPSSVFSSPLQPAPRRTTQTRTCALSWLSRPVGRPMLWRASSARGLPRNGARASSSRTAAAPAATSPRARSQRRTLTATRSSVPPAPMRSTRA